MVRLRPEVAIGPHGSGRDVGGGRGGCDIGEVDMAAGHRHHRRRSTVEGNVHHVDAEHRGHVGRQQVAAAAGAGTRIVHLARVRLGVGDEFLHVVDRQLGGDAEDQRERGEAGDELEAFRDLVGHRGLHRRQHGNAVRRRPQQGVAVRPRPGDVIDADRRGGTGPVLDDHVLAECLGEALSDDAGGEVGAAARRERHDDADVAGRVVGGLRQHRRHPPHAINASSKPSSLRIRSSHDQSSCRPFRRCGKPDHPPARAS